MTYSPPSFDSDTAMPMLGVPGRLTHRTVKDPGARLLWTHQRWISEARPIRGYGAGGEIRAEVEFDDACGNGHNTFTITAEVSTSASRSARSRDRLVAGGCMHDEIALAFPELAHLIRWHLVSSDGPMHYVANAVYMAGDRDHNGLRKGEKRALTDPQGNTFWQLRARYEPGVLVSAAHIKVSRDGVPYANGDSMPLHALDTSVKGGGRPAQPRLFWEIQLREGEGKARDLDAARRIAVWPDATDDELSAEPDVLRAALEARLPKLLEQFRTDVEAAGFYWSPAEFLDAMAGGAGHRAGAETEVEG